MITPKISIIVPIYNTEVFLRMCLDSIKAQTFSDFEVLMINDGSPDNSEEICLEYANLDDRFRYIYKENGGLSDARNCGLEAARGEYIMFLDSDDAIAKTAMASLIQIIESTEVDIVSFNYTRCQNKLQEIYSVDITEHQPLNESVLREYFYDDVSVYIRIYRAELLKDIRFVLGQISEDVLFTFKCYQKAKSICKTNYKFYFYNQSGASITRSYLSVRDHMSVDVNQELYRICKADYPELAFLAEQQVYKSMFDIVNKYAIRGYKGKEEEEFYTPLIPQYAKILRRNVFKILRVKKLLRVDKIQIFVLSISTRLFIRLKREFLKYKMKKDSGIL